MPLFQKVGGSTHWRHSRPEKKAARDTFDKRAQRREWRRKALKQRIAQRFSSGDKNVPF